MIILMILWRKAEGNWNIYYFCLVRAGSFLVRASSIRSRPLGTNQNEPEKTRQNTHGCSLMPHGASGFHLGLVRFWFVLVRSGSCWFVFIILRVFFTFLQSARARSSTNQNEPETNQTQIKSTRTRRHYRASMAVLPSICGCILVRAERARADWRFTNQKTNQHEPETNQSCGPLISISFGFSS